MAVGSVTGGSGVSAVKAPPSDAKKVDNSAEFDPRRLAAKPPEVPGTNNEEKKQSENSVDVTA